MPHGVATAKHWLPSLMNWERRLVHLHPMPNTAITPSFPFSGLQLKDDPNIVIAKSDATANDYPPGFDVRG